MVNFSSANSTNVTNVTSREGDTADVSSMAGAINVSSSTPSLVPLHFYSMYL